jgi:hypothetical protein
LASSYLFGFVMAFVGHLPDAILISSIAFTLAGSIVIQILFLRTLVRRVRDSGHRKSLAYLCLIPLANLGLIIYLAFKDSAPIPSNAS